LAYSNSI